MVWLGILGLSAFLIGLGIALSRPMDIPREEHREGPQAGDVARAYARVSDWAVFAVERRIILNALKVRNQGVLVDIGCGPGHLAARLARRNRSLTVIGLDMSYDMLDIARRSWPRPQYGAEFVMADAQRLPFEDSSVDCLVSSLSLHHWDNAEGVFREIRRVLKPGGRFLVFDLRRDGPRFFYYSVWLVQALLAPAAIRRTNGGVGSFWASYTCSELERILSGIDFDSTRVDAQFGWMLASGRKPE